MNVDTGEGSSPPARGADVGSFTYGARIRIIPACAGSRGFVSEFEKLYEDHPRLRGEQYDGYACTKKEVGSSPPARGAGMDSSTSSCVCRIIPACAGSSFDDGAT